MDRSDWIKAARLQAESYFSCYVGMDRPLDLPDPNRIGYGPSPGAHFETFARTFIAAAPLLRENPRTHIRGISIADYYARQLELYCDPASPQRLPDPIRGKAGYPIVEWPIFCLAVSLFGDVLWKDLAPSLRSNILDLMSAAAHGTTKCHNWRFFSVIVMAFLKRNGCAFDRSTYRDHLRNLLAWDSGDGWYRDGEQFDLYNAWAFHTYAAAWIALDGAASEPELAAAFETRLRTFLQGYPAFFDRGGRSLLWGRSACYRYAAAAPLACAFLLPSADDDPPIDPGWARRLCSGNLRQFAGRMADPGLPARLGFYGEFAPAVQRYSCAASPGWMNKLFFALAVRENSPFWTAPENEGFWPGLGDRIRTTVLPGPGLAAVSDGSTGDAVLLQGKANAAAACYDRIAYHSAFPWEAVGPPTKPGGPPIAAAGYTAVDLSRQERPPLVAARWRWRAWRGGILYRQLLLGEAGSHFTEKVYIDCADIPLPGALLRFDRVRSCFPLEIVLAHFGYPVGDGASPAIEKRSAALTIALGGARPEDSDYDTVHIDDGSSGISFDALYGWDTLDARRIAGLNPASPESIQCYAEASSAGSPNGRMLILASLLSYAPIRSAPTVERIDFVEPETGADADIHVDTGQVFRIRWNGLEGQLSR